MEKQKRINWMIVITGLLFLVSVIIFSYKLLSQKAMSSCLFEGVKVEYGAEITSKSGSKCTCHENNKILCDMEEKDSPEEESFSTKNLVFEYSYLNTISDTTPDSMRVLPVDINQNGEELIVIFEREGLCNENFEAPTQAGYYERYPDKLVLSTITSGDTENFNIPCLMSNSFKISKFNLEGEGNFEIYYRNEQGREFNLMACSYNGILYGQGDVFTASKDQSICSCEKGEIVCE